MGMSTKTAKVPVSKAVDQSAVPSGYQRTEVGVIPIEWDAVQIGEFLKFKNGLNKAKEFFGYGTPIVNYMDVFDHPGLGAGDIHGRVSLSRQEIDRFDVKAGDVFFTRTSETVDEIGTASVLLEDLEDGVFSGFVLRGRPVDNRLTLSFKKYCFAHSVVRSQIVSTATYTTRALTNGRLLSGVWVAIPPRNEQDAIAEALSDVDGLIGALEKLIVKKRAIKQAAMQQLLTGKTRLPGFTGEWTEKPMDDLVHVDPENLPSSTPVDYRFNYISLEQVDAGRLLGWTEERFETAPSRARRVLRHDDVLMSTVRPNLMAHLYYVSQIPNAVCSTGFAVLRSKPGCAIPGYIFAHLFAYGVNKQIEKTLAGSNYPAINGRDVKQISIPCPPDVDEQAAIANVLSDMDTEIAALEQRRDKRQKIKQGMMQQLLTGRVRLVNGEATA